MGYAELIQQRVLNLPPDKQAEVFDFVEFIAKRSPASQVQPNDQHKQRVLAALAAARAVWPPLESSQVEDISTDIRSQWDARGWDQPC